MALESTNNKLQVMYGYGEPPVDSMVPGGIGIDLQNKKITFKGETVEESINIFEQDEYFRINEKYTFDTSIEGVDILFTLPSGQPNNHSIAIEYVDVLRTALVKIDSAENDTITDVEKDKDTANIGKPSVVIFTYNANKHNWNWRI